MERGTNDRPLTKADFSKAVILGADYHGEWAKDVYLGFCATGMDAELIYTNTLFGGMGSTRVAAKVFLESVKQFFRQHAHSFFDFVKEIRRRMSERTLLRRMDSFRIPGKKLLIIFIWTPPSAPLLRSLKKMEGITLVLWQGEAPPRGPHWIPSFPYFDHVFYVDEDWLPLFDKEVQKKASFLPLSSSPTKFFPLKTEKKDPKLVSDIAFVGFYLKERAEMLAVLKDRDIKIYGYWWGGGMEIFPWLKEKYHGPLSNEDANQVFNAGKIQIGRLPSPVPYGDTITQRVFDVSLAGSFQLSRYSPAIERVFGDAVPMFHDANELRKMVDHYLSYPEERERLAAKAHAIALKDHTYASRIKVMLEVLGIQ